MSAGLSTAVKVTIPVSAEETIDGDLAVPQDALALILFAHGGSRRHSRRERVVSDALRQRRLGTLLLDLGKPDDERTDSATGVRGVDHVGLLAERLDFATTWVRDDPATCHLPVGYCGSGTAAAAALVAAARRPGAIFAAVSRGGRPDLAGADLEAVTAPTLLIVGGDDPGVEHSRAAFARLRCAKRLEIVPGAARSLQEPGALHAVAGLAGEWFSEQVVA